MPSTPAQFPRVVNLLDSCKFHPFDHWVIALIASSLAIALNFTYFTVVKVKSAFEPSGPSGRSLSRFL